MATLSPKEVVLSERFRRLIDEIQIRRCIRTKLAISKHFKSLNQVALSKTLSGKRPIHATDIIELKEFEPDIDLNWLYAGVGSPFLSTEEGTDSVEGDSVREILKEIQELKAMYNK